uniref:Uncharacterized protein n=1 Tax=Glossina palpalis gambiensis TaxID=67801 RepID=A0A1B0ATG4_9MUSC
MASDLSPPSSYSPFEELWPLSELMLQLNDESSFIGPDNRFDFDKVGTVHRRLHSQPSPPLVHRILKIVFFFDLKYVVILY